MLVEGWVMLMHSSGWGCGLGLVVETSAERVAFVAEGVLVGVAGAVEPELGVAALGVAVLGWAELGAAELGVAELGVAELGVVELGCAELGLVEAGLEAGAVVVVWEDDGDEAGADDECVVVGGCAERVDEAAEDAAAVGVCVGVATAIWTQSVLVAGLVAALAAAAPATACAPTASSRPPLTRPAAIARTCTKHMMIVLSIPIVRLASCQVARFRYFSLISPATLVMPPGCSRHQGVAGASRFAAGCSRQAAVGTRPSG